MTSVEAPTAPVKAARPGGTLAAYLAAAVVWGSSFLFMKVALTELEPGQVAVGRAVTGGVTLALLVVLTRRRWPRDPRLWGHLAVAGVLLCLAPFLLFAWAGQFLPSGLSAVLNATTPLWAALVTAAAVRGAALGRGQVVGVLVGAGGVAVVMGVWQLADEAGRGSSVPAQLACLAATLCYGCGFAWLRRFVVGRHQHDPLVTAAVQVGTAAVLALLLAPAVARGPLPTEPRVIGSMLALGCLGTGMAYVWNMRVVAEWGPVPASTVTYLTPVVGVALGVAVLGEHLVWHEPVGALVVLLGVMLTQRSAGRVEHPVGDGGGEPEDAGVGQQVADPHDDAAGRQRQ